MISYFENQWILKVLQVFTQEAFDEKEGLAVASIETNRQLSMGAPATFAAGCVNLLRADAFCISPAHEFGGALVLCIKPTLTPRSPHQRVDVNKIRQNTNALYGPTQLGSSAYSTSRGCFSMSSLKGIIKVTPPRRIVSKVAASGPNYVRKQIERHTRDVPHGSSETPPESERGELHPRPKHSTQYSR